MISQKKGIIVTIFILFVFISIVAFLQTLSKSTVENRVLSILKQEVLFILDIATSGSVATLVNSVIAHSFVLTRRTIKIYHLIMF